MRQNAFDSTPDIAEKFEEHLRQLQELIDSAGGMASIGDVEFVKAYAAMFQAYVDSKR